MRIFLLLFIALLGLLLPTANLRAGDHDAFIDEITSKDLVFTELDGIVMEYDLRKGQLVVLEKTIRLVDEKIGEYRLQTIVANRSGKSIRPELILVGTRVFVRGLSNDDGSILAREIYEVDPGGTQIDRIKREIPDWHPGKR